MVTKFVTIEVQLQSSAAQLQQVILAELQKVGEPLRWAIVSVDETRQSALVEAVVTSDFSLPLGGIISV